MTKRNTKDNSTIKNVNNAKFHKLSGFETFFNPWPWVHGIGSNNCYAYSMHDFRNYRKWKSTPGDKRNDTEPNIVYNTCGRLPERVLKDNPRSVYIHHKAGQPMKKYYSKCTDGHYKVVLVVAPPKTENNGRGDFHFLKHNRGIQHIVLKTDLRKPKHIPKMKHKREYAIHNIAKLYGIPKTLIRKHMPKVDPPVGMIFRIPLSLWSHKLGWATIPMYRDAEGKLIKDPLKANLNFSQHYSKYCTTFCVKPHKSKVGVSSNTNMNI